MFHSSINAFVVPSVVYSVLVAVTTVGCSVSSNEVDAVIEDHVAPVTDDPADNLVTLRLLNAGESYAVDELLLTWGVPGATPTAMDLVLSDDLDADGRFGPGDTLTGVEPGLDQVGSADAGQAFEVTLMQELGASRVRTLFSGEWLAN